MVAIIDYGMGNLGSILNKMNRLGVESIITSDTKKIQESNKLILPGVGHFAKAVKEIKKRSLWHLITEQVINREKPILGICLGMQLMASYSEEGSSEGFGWIDAIVLKLQVVNKNIFKIPHIGWNTLKIEKGSPLFVSVKAESEYYFAHSFHLICNDSQDVLAKTMYETEFVSVIQKRNIFGTQFHPEKSYYAGDLILKNFISI